MTLAEFGDQYAALLVVALGMVAFFSVFLAIEELYDWHQRRRRRRR